MRHRKASDLRSRRGDFFRCNDARIDYADRAVVQVTWRDDDGGKDTSQTGPPAISCNGRGPQLRPIYAAIKVVTDVRR